MIANTLREALSDRYTIERELGRGGMAAVYLARDVRHDRAVAIKVLEGNVAHAGAERFLREIRTAARLTHPHVLGVHDSGEADGLLYYVMPFVDGETLRARLAREGALPLADAVRIMRELAEALAYAHGHGVMHRDLKPENVLISGGHAVVADFGIAKAIEAATSDGTASQTGLTSAGVALGTPAYMAPEQAVGDEATDHRADLYALGIIAYEALAGTHPFGGRSAQALVTAHLTEAPAPLNQRRADAPPALVALIMQLIAKDPAARPQSAESVLRALDGAALPTTTRANALRTSRRRFAAAAALMLVVGVGAYAVWRGTRASALPLQAGSPAVGAIHTLAVLPFVNTGGVAEDDYFSDGLTDELSHALARLPGLRLSGRTSAYQFKGKSPGPQEIRRVLDVDAFIAGTMRRSGDALRVTTQLINTTDGKLMWDSVYESRSNDVFAVQDQFTRAIVVALTPALGARSAGTPLPDLGRGTTNQEAYELYLKGRYFYLNRNTVNVGRAIEFFREAVAKDSAFAGAHAALALTYSILRIYVSDPSDSATRLATISAERAMALDSTIADAQIAIAATLSRRMRLPEALAHFQKSIVIEPWSETGHRGLAFQYLDLGRNDDALSHLQQAAQLDPLAKSSLSGISLTFLASRRFPEALAAAHHVFKLDSSFTLGIKMLGMSQLFGGQADSAVLTFERGVRLQPKAPGFQSGLLFSYAATGRWSDAERIREQLRKPGGDPSGGIESDFADLVFGDREPMVRRLVTKSGQIEWKDLTGMLGCHPWLDPLWVDARFRAAMRERNVDPCPLARPWPILPRKVS